VYACVCVCVSVCVCGICMCITDKAEKYDTLRLHMNPVNTAPHAIAITDQDFQVAITML